MGSGKQAFEKILVVFKAHSNNDLPFPEEKIVKDLLEYFNLIALNIHVSYLPQAELDDNEALQFLAVALVARVFGRKYIQKTESVKKFRLTIGKGISGFLVTVNPE